MVIHLVHLIKSLVCLCIDDEAGEWNAVYVPHTPEPIGIVITLSVW